jgi:hypothetical protein
VSEETSIRLEQLEQIRDSANSPHQKDLARLKAKFGELTKLVDVTPQHMCAQLMDIVKTAEDMRAKEIKGAEDMERKAKASRAKADGFSMFSSIVYNMVCNHVSAAQRDAAERAMLEADRVKSEEAAEEAKRAAKKKKTARKPRKKMRARAT